MARYSTRNQLLFSRPRILESMALRLKGHVKRYKILPKRIYLSKKDFEEYKMSFNEFNLHKISFSKIKFRGIPVLWRGYG